MTESSFQAKGADKLSSGKIAPVAAGERIHVLDILRGFALFGVLLANMVWFFSGYGNLEPEAAARLSTAVLDPLVLGLISFFVSSKFISIFSFLFGVGFAIQMGRARERGMLATPLYVRRLLWLLGFGVAHMFLVWYGDILHLYALLGLLLIGWVSRSNRTLVAGGIAFAILVPVLIEAILWLLPRITEGVLDPADAFETRREAAKALHAAFAEGTYAEAVRANAADAWAWFSTDDALTTGAASFGLFLFGLLAGRSGILARASTGSATADRALLRRGLFWGLGVGAACQGIVLIGDHVSTLASGEWQPQPAMKALWRVGVLGMVLSYVCGIVLLFRDPAWRHRLRFFAPVGRMALSNYLSQSVICVFLFYGWGLGWYGSVGPTGSLGLTFLVFAAQLAASAWWLQRFRFGPAEWAWRSLTYGKMQPFRSSGHGGNKPMKLTE
jgi:uncharacterized protein